LEKKVAISSPGIGSNLDVNGIVAKLMAVEAQPLTTLERKASSFQAKISALGALSGGISSFQSSLSALTSISSFQSNGAISNNTDIMVGSATSKAVPGTYKVNVTQIAQAQTLVSAGKLSTTSAIGLGGSTTISFQLGTVSGGSYGMAGGALPGAVVSGGIANGALTINGTAISTDATTRSAKALAEAINAKNATTGVSASMANLDAVLGGSNATTVALNDAGISWTGSAADGTLQFTAADGRNLTVAETTTGLATGGIDKLQGTPNGGTSVTTSSTITLASSSGNPITVAGTNPAAAGLVAGTGGTYVGAGFAQDPEPGQWHSSHRQHQQFAVRHPRRDQQGQYRRHRHHRLGRQRHPEPPGADLDQDRRRLEHEDRRLRHRRRHRRRRHRGAAGLRPGRRAEPETDLGGPEHPAQCERHPGHQRNEQRGQRDPGRDPDRGQRRQRQPDRVARHRRRQDQRQRLRQGL
jgi:hypothetical protein